MKKHSNEMRSGPRQRNCARRLRAEPTEAEKRLWLTLRPLRHSHGLHVRRQMPLGPYIVDFAIVSRKLVIEVDGGQLGDAADVARDRWIKAKGHGVLRFWNTEVFDNLEGVMETIFLACGSPHPLSLPASGEGGEIPTSGKISSHMPEGVGVGNATQSRRLEP